MTGFGRFQVADEKRTLEVEVRSVNHRFLKLQIRLPRDLSRLEPEIEAQVKKILLRGSVNVTIRNEELSDEAAVTVDHALARQLNIEAEKLAQDLGREKESLSIETLFSLPGVVRPGEKSDSVGTERKAAILAGVNEALSGLMDMRKFEGEKLAEELHTIAGRIRVQVQAVQSRAPMVVAEYGEKLKKRLHHLLAQNSDKVAVDDKEVLREVALFADKADISEELQRLESHLEQFDELLQEKEIGRKLDFLLQEMLRETNTVASKASDSEIARCVIEVKTDLERLREQSHNIE